MPVLASSLLALAATGSVYSDYPAFVDRQARIEAFIDKGPIVEMIVKCPVGTGILSYSKIERRYCSSKHVCFTGLKAAMGDTCG